MRHIWLAVSVIIAAACAGPAAAGGLDDLDENAGQMDFFRKEGSDMAAHLYSCQWGGEGTEYSMLFCGKRGTDLLENWINIKSLEYKCDPPFKQNAIRWLQVDRKCHSPTGARVAAMVLVPHPRYVDQAKDGLLESFSDPDPPRLRVDSSEAVKIGSLPATLYHQKKNQCSILLKLPKGAVINFSGECSNVKAMIKLGELLTVDYLKKKLES